MSARLSLVDVKGARNQHARKQAARVDKPLWASWRGSRVGRCVRWIETYLNLPTGVSYGRSFKLADYQHDILEILLADEVRTGGLQICRGNAKSTLIAALGLWALVTEEDSPQVPLVAYNARHAERTLFTPIKTMLRYSPQINDYVVVYNNQADKRILSAWNNGELYPLPASEEALQGLNPTVGIVDEAQTVEDSTLWALRQGAGKRPRSLILAIGTPGPDHQSALYRMRELAANDAGVTWAEYSAPLDCDLNDRAAWHEANPALAAGILDLRVIEDEARAVALDHPGARAMFRMYRLGHWVEGAAGWLPPGCWEACPSADKLTDGTDVVLAVDGTYRRSTAIVLATVGDADLHFGWAAEQASDDEVRAVIDEAMARYNVVEIVHFPKVRSELLRHYEEEGDTELHPWKGFNAEEVTSANEFHRAVVEQRIRHDHNETLNEHMNNVHARITQDGLRLTRPLDDGRWIDAAMAARMAWWRAIALEPTGPRIFVME